MGDLPEDQLPDTPDPLTLRVMGRGEFHKDYQWIVDGLRAVGRSQADLARYLEKHLGVSWDQPTMSRQLKGGRVLKAKEDKLIRKFFAENGHSIGTEGDQDKESLTKISHSDDRTEEQTRPDLEGKVDIMATLLTELQQTVSDLRGRVQILEHDHRQETLTRDPRKARRKL